VTSVDANIHVHINERGGKPEMNEVWKPKHTRKNTCGGRERTAPKIIDGKHPRERKRKKRIRMCHTYHSYDDRGKERDITYLTHPITNE
jgi:hypothetical protein